MQATRIKRQLLGLAGAGTISLAILALESCGPKAGAVRPRACATAAAAGMSPRACQAAVAGEREDDPPALRITQDSVAGPSGSDRAPTGGGPARSAAEVERDPTRDPAGPWRWLPRPAKVLLSSYLAPECRTVAPWVRAGAALE